MQQRADQSRPSSVSRVRVNSHATPRPRRKLTKREMAFAEEGLSSMHRLVDECARMSERIDELKPRFKQACMQKAWFIVISYLVGFLLLLFSLLWSGAAIILVRIAIVGILVGLYFAPVYWFTRGGLRAEAKLTRQLDKKGLANAKEAARIGESMNLRLGELFGSDRAPPQ